MSEVFVITPTWNRHELLLDRCIPSVLAQTYPFVRHLIVSDGPDPELPGLVYERTKADVTSFGDVEHQYIPGMAETVELPEHHGGFGVVARNWGLDHSESEFVAFLDDDNAYHPHHLDVLIAALHKHPEAGFAYGKMYYPQTGFVLGSHPPAINQIDGSMFVARRELFDIARWEWTGAYAIDWQLIEKWVTAGVESVFLDQVTLDYYWPAR